ncbi:MAG: GAF domain-containing protein [Chloroflexi bacterium]|nr:GAF domain-containing protein [Chloroflexota bacterium]
MTSGSGKLDIGRMWRRLSLAKKIVVLAFAGSAVVVASFALLAMWSLQQSTDRSLQERLVLATAAAESVDQYNRIVFRPLVQVADAAALALENGDTSAANEALRTGPMVPGFLFRNLVIANAAGEIVAVRSGDAPSIGSSVGDFDGAKAPFKDRSETHISGIVRSSIDGAPSVVYAVPVVDPAGRVIGVLAGEMKLGDSGIGGFISKITLGQTGYAQVVDGDGDLIASTRPLQVSGNVDHGDRFVSLIRGKQAVVRTCHSCHEPATGAATRRKDILAFAPLQTASWGVAVRQSEEEALAQTRRLQELMLVVGVVAFGVAFPGTIAIASRAVRPVLSLRDASKRIAAGDLATAIPPMGEDEIGTLAQNLEYMRVSLRESHQEVERRRREAESLYDIGLEISALLDTDKILGSVVSEARALLGADLSILMIRDDHGKLYVKATNGNLGEELKKVSLAPGQGFAGAVVERGYPLSTDDYMNDPTFVHERTADAVVSEEGLRSLLGVPLKIGSEVLGSLIVGRREVRAFSKQETALLGRLGNQASIAIGNANLFEEVRRKEELRGQLLEKAISAQEEERKRIARELHDEPAQIFSALVMQLEAMANELPQSEAPVKLRLQRLQSLAAHALETVRKMMSDLRPTALDDLGLIPAIRQYAEGRLGEIEVKVNVRASNMGARLPPQMETVIFRVLQEAVNNVYKHAGAKSVTIELRRDKSAVRATVRDDGRGFRVDDSEKPGPKGGLGLLGIKERVGLIGGRLTIRSRPGRGTELKIEIPMAEGGKD